MTAATPHFVSTGDIATALKTQVQLVKLADNTTAAFQRVELFDSESLLEAFKILTISEQRICLIVPLTEHWETETMTRKIITRKTVNVALLISDRVLGNRTTALYGDGTNATPGAHKLVKFTLPLVIGQLLNNPNGVVSVPTSADVIIVKNEKEKQNLPGRSAVALELECQGGWIEAALAVGPTL
jgi:hypothetical protein